MTKWVFQPIFSLHGILSGTVCRVVFIMWGGGVAPTVWWPTAIYAEAQMRGLEIASIFGYSYNKKISPDDNKNVNATPGTGLVDFPGLFKRLRQGGFREGSLIIECLDNVDGSQLISEAIQARKMLEELVA